MTVHVAVVVPCFNEAARLDVAAFAAFVASHDDVVFILVDDGSRDGTGALLRSLAERLPDRVRVLTLPSNQGKAEAVRLGVLDALQRRPEIVGYVDADLATPLSAIPQLVAVFREHPSVEMVFGARVRLITDTRHGTTSDGCSPRRSR